MNFFKRRKILKDINTLDLIPVRICSDFTNDDRSVILVPKFKKKWIHNLFPVTRNMFFNVRLDKTGTIVWKNICGKKNVNDICSIFLNESKDEMQFQEELKQRISRFIIMLYERECITFQQLSGK